MCTYKIYYSYSTGTPGPYILPVFEGVQVVHLILFIHVNHFGYFHYHVCVCNFPCVLSIPGISVLGYFLINLVPVITLYNEAKFCDY